MPVLTDLTISIEPENLLRRAGISNRSKDKELLQMMLFELNTDVETLRLLRPCILYELHNVIGVRGSRVMLENGAYITSRFLSSLYPSLKAVVALICTIGHDLEDMMATFYHRGEQLRVFLLDAIGSAAIDALAAEACHIIEQAVFNRGMNAGSPLSPGMPGLSISEQSILFALAPAEMAGVSLSAGGIMRPLKSLSMIIPAGEKMPVWGKKDMCRRCNLRKSCPSSHYSES